MFSKKAVVNMLNVKARVKVEILSFLVRERDEPSNTKIRHLYVNWINNFEKDFDKKWDMCYNPSDEDDVNYYKELSEDECVERLSECVSNRYI